MTTKRMDKADDFQPQSKEIKSQLQRHYCLFFIIAHLLAFILCAFMIYISQPGTCKFLLFTSNFFFVFRFCKVFFFYCSLNFVSKQNYGP